MKKILTCSENLNFFLQKLLHYFAFIKVYLNYDCEDMYFKMSMISNVLLAESHLHLNTAFRKTVDPLAYFGDLNIILIGDLCQVCCVDHCRLSFLIVILSSHL